MSTPAPIPDLTFQTATNARSRSSAVGGGSSTTSPFKIGDFKPESTNWLLLGVVSLVTLTGFFIISKRGK